MIGGRPAATMKEYLSLASIQEASGNESTEEMVQAIVKDFETVNAELAEGIKAAAEASDEVTVDLFVTISKDLQKNIWMLKTLLD